MASTADSQPPAALPPWYAAYPSPKYKPAGMTREEVLEMMKGGIAGVDYLLVDLRRSDHEGGTIRGSVNLPAQSLYPSIATLYKMAKAAGVRKVIWYCSSSRGRGPRAAGWFGDYLIDQADFDMQSLVLEGGIRGWAMAGTEFVARMDEYDEPFWSVGNSLA